SVAADADRGVRVGYGSVAGGFDHGRHAEEFALMISHGLAPREAVASATTVAAEVLGRDGQIGRIANGYSAVLIAFDGNPLEDVTVLEEIDWVMVRGRVID